MLKPKYLFDWMIFLFLSANLFLRLNELIQIKSLIVWPSLLAIVVGFYLNFRPKHLAPMLFVFGMSFPPYGSRSFSINSQMLELLLVIICLTFFFINRGGRKTERLNRQIVYLVILYSVLSALSLLLLPIRNLFEIISLWDLYSVAGLLLNSTPDTYVYSFAAVNRLVLFLTFIFQLSKMDNAVDLYRHLFSGMAVGCVIAMLLGLIEYHDLIPLNWMRPDYRKLIPRLQSTFENPGWFAEYVIVTIPFIFNGFFGKRKSPLNLFFLASILLLCAFVLVFIKSRAAWIIYPFTLICLITLVYRTNAHNNLRLKLQKIGIFKILVSLPLFILISLFIGNHFVSKYISLSEKREIKARFDNLIKPNENIRLKIWRETLHLGKENIFFGMGYESFRWHSEVLNDITASDFAKHRAKDDKLFDTPHNFFLQLFISGGLTAIFIWLVLTSYVLLLLYYDFIHNRHELNISVILSIISFHLYGMFQSMQYIPVIWFIIFLNFGYAMAISDTILPIQIKTISEKMVIVSCIVLPIAGGIAYIQNMESKKNAEKYGLKYYAKDQDRDHYIGFYAPEKWADDIYRWSSRRGLLKFTGNGLIGLTYQFMHPDIDKKPVILEIVLNGKIIDRLTAFARGSIGRQYYLHDVTPASHQIMIKVSRTWIPKKFNINEDRRSLGVAVSRLRHLKLMPTNGVGFYDVKTLSGGSKSDDLNQIPPAYRLTGQRASINVEKEIENSETIHLMCAHPNIHLNPVRIDIKGDNGIIRQEYFNNHQWKRIALSPDEIKRQNVLTFQANRTWNPKLMGISDDSRDLGVAVAIVKGK